MPALAAKQEDLCDALNAREREARERAFLLNEVFWLRALHRYPSGVSRGPKRNDGVGYPPRMLLQRTEIVRKLYRLMLQ